MPSLEQPSHKQATGSFTPQVPPPWGGLSSHMNALGSEHTPPTHSSGVKHVSFGKHPHPSSPVMQGAAELLAYGTAVKTEPRAPGADAGAAGGA